MCVRERECVCECVGECVCVCVCIEGEEVYPQRKHAEHLRESVYVYVCVCVSVSE